LHFVIGPGVVAIHTAANWTEDKALQLAASLEAGSEHPLATAILDAANKKQLDIKFRFLPRYSIWHKNIR